MRQFKDYSNYTDINDYPQGNPVEAQPKKANIRMTLVSSVKSVYPC